MIAVLKNGTTPSQIQHLVDWLKNMNLDVHISEGSEVTILGLVGDTSRVDIDLLKSLEMVETVKRISEPFKLANRKFHPKDTIIEAGNARIGGGYFAMIAGPCSVESEEQIIAVASAVKESGASILRGGAFKPRTSPYAFQGMKDEGIRLLLEAKKATGLPIVTEIMNISTLDLFADVDIIQVGARNMQNFDLLKELGKTDKPILLKRGLANTLQELLMSAEYIMSEGNSKVILCERGIRTFETATRNTLDLSAVPVLHNLTHLPVVVDPSHATGKADLVAPMAYAATAAGADGIYFQSFTETYEHEIAGVSIADAVVRWVFSIAARLYREFPSLEIRFGLHATSVADSLGRFASLDPRMKIIFEDCGAFPYAYDPTRVEDAEATRGFAARAIRVCGEGRYGCIYKGMPTLYWCRLLPSGERESIFRHIREPFLLGEADDAKVDALLSERREAWKYCQAEWIRNADYARRETAAIAKETGGDAVIQLLCEYGALEKGLFLPMLLASEILWNPTEDKDDIIERVMKSPLLYLI